MHTSDIHAAKRISFNINDQSEFARAVAEYKKGECKYCSVIDCVYVVNESRK